ncbi:MAG: hypothetical protein LBD12_03715, partial [Clostridiales Family XIII bacterium]|nr:hypothetical protein [Clostridiales Family XIII bacterium]
MSSTGGTQGRRVFIILLCLLCALYACIVPLDWAALLNGVPIPLLLRRCLKLAGILLCLVVSIVVRAQGTRSRDAGLQVVILAFAVCADILLIFTRQFAAGILLFWGAHLAGIRRYTRNLLPPALALAVFAGLLCAALALTGRSEGILPVVAGTYAVFIICVTLGTFRDGQEKANRILSRVGMVLF